MTNQFKTNKGVLQRILRAVNILLMLLSSSCDMNKSKPRNSAETATIKKSSFPYDNIYNTTEFKGENKPKVSILGTFHFTNNALHDYNDTYKLNGLATSRQQELQELVEKLQSFRPTKILIERNRIAYDSIITQEYQRYYEQDSTFQINDEVYLIAFPLAKQMRHNKVFASDAVAPWFGMDLDWENFDESAFLKERKQYKKSNRYNYETSYKKEDSLKSVLPLLEFYRLINSPKVQLYNHQIYLTETVLSGAGDNYMGADAVARWYRRNLRIFSNTLDLVDFNKEERILIIYGASHIWTLKQFFQDSPDFEYLEINSFLD